jgi:hypothetical protein
MRFEGFWVYVETIFKNLALLIAIIFLSYRLLLAMGIDIIADGL